MTDFGEHLSGEDLLLLSSGEMSGPEADAAKRHARDCAACRRLLDDCEAAVHGLRRMIEVEQRRGFARKLDALAAGRRRAAIRRISRMASAGAAAACLVAGLLFFWNGSVHAAAANRVLEQAVRIEQRDDASRPAAVRLHAGGLSCDAGRSGIRAIGSGDDACSNLMGVLQAARWDTSRPLSASAFLRWRESVTLPYDRVTRVGHEVEISTTAFGGPIRNVRLTLDAKTLRARVTRIVRPGSVPAIDIVEEPPASSPISSAPAEPEPPPAQPAVTASVHRAIGLPAAAAAEPDPLLEAEILVRVRLHAVRADEGYETLVRRVGGALAVFGLCESADRKEVVLDALSGIAGVRVELKTFAEAQIGDDAPFGIREPAGNLPRVAEEWLKARFPVFEDRAMFVNRVSELAGALVGLAKTRDEVSALLGAARGHANSSTGDLTRVLDDLERRTAAFAAELAAMLEPVAGTARQPAPLTFEEALAIDTAVTRMFIGNNDAGAGFESERARLRDALRR